MSPSRWDPYTSQEIHNNPLFLPEIKNVIFKLDYYYNYSLTFLFKYECFKPVEVYVQNKFDINSFHLTVSTKGYTVPFECSTGIDFDYGTVLRGVMFGLENALQLYAMRNPHYGLYHTHKNWLLVIEKKDQKV